MALNEMDISPMLDEKIGRLDKARDENKADQMGARFILFKRGNLLTDQLNRIDIAQGRIE
ncbi:hypothetical protein LZ023_37670 (plasmid) [Pseudomonas silvicola]|nr:hypothetical protein LZ023_37670 [Pseudomonas silvicola]